MVSFLPTISGTVLRLGFQGSSAAFLVGDIFLIAVSVGSALVVFSCKIHTPLDFGRLFVVFSLVSLLHLKGVAVLTIVVSTRACHIV